MKILVCGGAGYIGTQLVRELLRTTEHAVVIVDTLEATHGSSAHVESEYSWQAKAAAGAPLSRPRRFAEVEVGDVRDAVFLRGVFAKHAPVDAVVHMCAYAVVPESVRDPLKYYDNNVIGMIRILQAMREHHCDKLILSSTCSLFGNAPRGNATNAQGLPLISPDTAIAPENPYAETKYVCEMLLRDAAVAYGIKSVCLRYFNACGGDGDIGEMHDPETHLIPLVLRVPLAQTINAYNARYYPDRPRVPDHVCICGTDYPTPDGTCVRDYIHIKDLAHAHIKTLDHLAALTADDRARYFTTYNLGTSRGYSVREVIAAARRVTGHAIPAKEVERRPGDPAVLVASGSEVAAALKWTIEYDTIDKIIQSAWDFHRTQARVMEQCLHKL